MLTPEKLNKLLSEVTSIASRAGEEIMKIYQAEDFSIQSKSDDSPLTAADLASHHCITESLEKLQPEFPILSEESGEIPFNERQQWETYWLIDPLDGTKEFIKRNGQFTVNIALIHNHQPILGVVDVPAKKECYFGALQVGAFKLQGDQQQSISVRSLSEQELVVVGSRSHRTQELDDYLEKLGPHQLIPTGSSLKFCLVAEGKADLYPRIGPTCEWDTAAAQAVVESAGGSVVDTKGAPLRYNQKESLLNPYFLVFGDDSRNWASYAESAEGN